MDNHWYDLGLQLLDPKYEIELDIIEGDKNDTKTSCRQMLIKWLSTDKLASWDKVIKALTHIELNNVASNIQHLLGGESELQMKALVKCRYSPAISRVGGIARIFWKGVQI